MTDETLFSLIDRDPMPELVGGRPWEEALRTALIEGETGGLPAPLDAEAFLNEMRSSRVK